MGAGTLFLAGACIPLIKMAVYNASKFSYRRHILGPDGQPMPVMDFRTQHLPILHAIARAHVLQAFLIYAGRQYCIEADSRVRHIFATTFKAVTIHHFKDSLKPINEGCGWQGYYDRNQILAASVSLSLTIKEITGTANRLPFYSWSSTQWQPQKATFES